MDIDNLISEIFIRPALWDQTNKNHHNRFVLDKLWDEVALKLNTTRTIVRNKWKSLRDKFRTTLASIPKPKSGDAQINYYKGEWKHFKSMLFLKDQFTPRKSEGNFPKNNNEHISVQTSQMSQDESGESSEDEVSEQAVEAEIMQHAVEDEIMQSPPQHFEHLGSAPATSSVTGSLSRVSTPAIKYRKKRQPKDDIAQSLLMVEQQKLQLLEKKKNKKEEDEDLNFFKSLLPHVQTLSPYDKLEYRMKVMKLTQEFVKPSKNYYANENTSNPNYNSTSSCQQNTARHFYNDAGKNLNSPESECHLFNPYSLE